MQQSLKLLVKGVYDIQQLRIQTGLRIVSSFKAKLGQVDGIKEKELDRVSKNLLKRLRLSHKNLTDGIILNSQKFIGDGLIDTFSEYCLIDSYILLEAQEKVAFKNIEKILPSAPIYNEFLKDVRGVGPAMSAVIISCFDIHKANYPSSLQMYAGIDVAPDGSGRSWRKEHLVDRVYVAKDGTTKVKKSITYNAFLKSKLLGVLAPSFIKLKNPKYSKIYYDYKHRLINHPKHKEKSLKHIHNMCLRYMLKIFLIDLYNIWRPLEGLPVSVPYHEAKLGIIHSKAA